MMLSIMNAVMYEKSGRERLAKSCVPSVCMATDGKTEKRV